MEVYAISFLFTDVTEDNHIKVDEGDRIKITLDCGSVIIGELKTVDMKLEEVTIDTDFYSEVELKLSDITDIVFV